MTWFEHLTGFQDISHEQVRRNMELRGEYLHSRLNGRVFQCGRLELLSLESLRRRFDLNGGADQISVREVIGDVRKLHMDPQNAHALFQAASQFNLLEMVGPGIGPEAGISIYEDDHTQGPACAISCGAGTIYRNYFAKVNGRVGQTRDNQIDCLAKIGEVMGNTNSRLWEMRNGYALATCEGLTNIDSALSSISDSDREELKGKLEIGVQWDTEVTLSRTRHLVSQAYCSALPVAYSELQSCRWERFARLILEAAYEATLYAALENLMLRGVPVVYLTKLGGGAFGNRLEWVTESMAIALSRFALVPLDVRIVSYGRPDVRFCDLLYKEAKGWE